MATTEELLAQMESASTFSVESSDRCVIDPESRTILIPETYQILGVESDEKAERIEFQCPRIVGDNIDLSTLQIRINYRNALGTDTADAKDQYIVDDVAVEGENITFSWLLSRKVTAYRGVVNFIICAVRVTGGVIKNEWNTTLAQSLVLEGLEVDDPQPVEEQSDVVAQLVELMTNTQSDAQKAVDAAEAIIGGELSQLVPSVENHIIVFDYTAY